MKRRNFIKSSSAAAAASTVGFPALVRAQNQNSKLQVGFVATGGRANAHVGFTYGARNKYGLHCVAFAEVDRNSHKNVLGKGEWKDAKAYTDWREMFQKHTQELDVVFVATPDHSHYGPSMTAISNGIHCYTEKPLAWSVREAQNLTKAYAKNTGVVTQMGNQGHAGGGWRTAYEYVKGGAIGDIKEFHTWTNRPVWPQGGDNPEKKDPVPDHLDWDSWIGPAPMRHYTNGVYPFKWRGFVDFGSGALGDMACHTTYGIYSIMRPGYAATAEPLFMTGPCKGQFPSGMIIKATYRATKDRPGFATYWYEGKKDGKPIMPDVPEELKGPKQIKMPRTGNLIIGTKGKMIVMGDYWNTPRLIPEERQKEFGKPKQLLERSPGHHDEFLMACRGDKPREFSQSNFGYSGFMTANIQLGNLSARAAKKLELNEAGEITNDPSINELAWRVPRKGWDALKTNI
ncbi:MAG: Gfo/Idh/MocA family oxidoreductase [Verrucomicrobiota bacterium]